MNYEMMICAIVVSNKEGGVEYGKSEGLIWREIPRDIFKALMGGEEDHDSIPGVLLSELWFFDEGCIFSGDELLKVKEEINELIEKQLVTQEDMQEILKLLQFGIDNHRRVFFTSFWWDDIPSAEI